MHSLEDLLKLLRGWTCLWPSCRITVWWLSHWQALLSKRVSLGVGDSSDSRGRDSSYPHWRQQGLYLYPTLHPPAWGKEETHEELGRQTVYFTSSRKKTVSLSCRIAKKWEKKRENFTGWTLATECLTAGDVSLRYYREIEPGKKNKYCFSPHPINFVINKSDS